MKREVFVLSYLQVPDRSAAAKAGLVATRRGLAGNIMLGDIIVAVGDTSVSKRLQPLKSRLHKITETILSVCKSSFSLKMNHVRYCPISHIYSQKRE